jgi:hypothetical protein
MEEAETMDTGGDTSSLLSFTPADPYAVFVPATKGREMASFMMIDILE